MTDYLCEVCGWVFCPAAGDIISGVDAGTDFADLPDTYTCPVCYAMKSQFVEVQI